jgi:hypothetical protein
MRSQMKFRVVYVHLTSLKTESFRLTNLVKEFGGVRVNMLRAPVLEPPLTLPVRSYQYALYSRLQPRISLLCMLQYKSLPSLYHVSHRI